MTSDKSHDRESLMHKVRQALDREHSRTRATTPEPTSQGESAFDPLGNVVRELIDEFGSPSTAADQSVSRNGADRPIPLAEVAAFVDGTLVDANGEQEICSAAVVDPGVLMEIVSAVRSRDQATSLPLDDALRTRLLRLHAAAPAVHLEPPGDSTVEIQSTAGIQSTARIRSTATLEPAAEIGSDVEPPLVPTRSFDRRLAVLATAAAAIFAIGWWLRANRRDSETPVAIEPTKPPAVVPQVPSPVDPDPGAGTAPRLANAEPTEPEAEVIGRAEPRRREATASADDRRPLGDDTSDDSGLVLSNPARPLPDETTVDRGSVPEMPPLRSPPPTPSAVNDDPLVATWTEINGLLLTSTSQTSEDSIPANAPLRAVAREASTTFDADAEGGEVRLRTLPLCRAVGRMEAGAELVVAADTRIAFADGGLIDLHFGSFAVSTSRPLTLRFRLAGNEVDLQTSTESSFVVERTSRGLEFLIKGEPIRIAGHPVAESRVAIDTTMTVQPMGEAPERLPRWTTETVDRIRVGRNLLAQLGGSGDVRQTMMEMLKSGEARGAAGGILRRWIVSASEDDLTRLVRSEDPLLREAALQYLLAVHPGDPRHRYVWRDLQSSVQARPFLAARPLFADAWAGRRPNPARREQLLRMLQSPDPGARVTANFLLRAYFGAGPPFDLNAAPGSQTRAAEAWRTIMSRTE